MGTKYEALFTPFCIGSVEIKNRIVQCPMDPGPFIRPDRTFNEITASMLIERARGGVGLIISGCCLVEKHNRAGMFADDADVFIPAAHDMTEKIHEYGTKIFCQLSAGVGRNFVLTPESVVDGSADLEADAVAPSSDTPNVWMPSIMHHELTQERIRKIIQGFADAAEIVQKAGFDGIEVHAMHEGYLLDQFSIGSLNKRTDEYGGTLENRLRFASEILQAIKQRCGDDYPVIMRFSVTSKMKGLNQGALPGETYVEYGRSLEESPDAAKMLEQMGYDALDADNGSYDAWYWAHPPMYMPMMCNLPDAAFIKEHVNIPVFCAGKMDDPEGASRAVQTGQIDAVALGRALLADPEWPNKVKDAQVEDIRPCIACQNGCLRTFLNQTMTCAVNPRIEYGTEGDFRPAEAKKHVIVIGGGIGGMEAARICAVRGHTVDLYEKSDVLGGVFIAAAQPSFKEADKKLIEWYRSQIKKTGVKVHLGVEVTSEMVSLSGADAVIMATGAVERKLPVPGVDRQNVISAVDVLLGNRETGHRVAVIGGGLTGCEIAYEQALQGKKVCVIEMLPDILQVPGLCHANSLMLRDLLLYHNVDILANAKVERIEDEGVVISMVQGESIVPADTVITAIGYIPNNELKIINMPVIKIGDCKVVRNLLSVISDAYEAALQI